MQRRSRRMERKADGALVILPSKPEPPPIPGKEDVTATLLERLQIHDDLHKGDPDFNKSIKDVHFLITQRRLYGMEKYGTTLQTDNGRDPIEDCKQELGDALQYWTQAEMEGRDVEPLRVMLRTMNELFFRVQYKDHFT